MGSIKKNLSFTIVVAICVLVFAAGAYMAYAESSRISEAKQKISSAETQLNNFRYADPAPTEENVIASEKNLAELDKELQKIREVFQRGARITTSTDGIGVTAAIQQYIAEYQRKAARYTYTDSKGEEQPIQLPNNIGFGFEDYLGETPTLDDSGTTAELDKQRRILSYLLDKLYESKPHSLVSVKREILEKKNGNQASKNNFKVDKAITSKVPGAIDTMGFSLSFTGYTKSLRDFLNQLRKFDLPIVVRSIEVSRPSGVSVVEATADGALDNIFAGFGGGDSESSETPREVQKSVISQNVSTFTVVVEFIQLIITADKNV